MGIIHICKKFIDDLLLKKQKTKYSTYLQNKSLLIWYTLFTFGDIENRFNCEKIFFKTHNH